jgi:hypothetical protein
MHVIICPPDSHNSGRVRTLFDASRCASRFLDLSLVGNSNADSGGDMEFFLSFVLPPNSTLFVCFSEFTHKSHHIGLICLSRVQAWLWAVTVVAVNLPSLTQATRAENPHVSQIAFVNGIMSEVHEPICIRYAVSSAVAFTFWLLR